MSFGGGFGGFGQNNNNNTANQTSGGFGGFGASNNNTTTGKPPLYGSRSTLTAAVLTGMHHKGFGASNTGGFGQTNNTGGLFGGSSGTVAGGFGSSSTGTRVLMPHAPLSSSIERTDSKDTNAIFVC